MSSRESRRWLFAYEGLAPKDFYRDARRRMDILMDGSESAGGRWNFDADNRESPPACGLRLPAPPTFAEDAIDEQVRRDRDA